MGIPTSQKLEIEFTPGVWSDVSKSVAVSESVTITNRGKPNEFDEPGPAILEFTLDNHSGNFTPDNPISIYFPNVQEDKRVRFTITINGVTSKRFEGTITSIEPDFYAAVADLSRVKITASDDMYILSNRRLRSWFVEEGARIVKLPGQYGSIFTFGGPDGVREYPNLGSLPVPNTYNDMLSPAVIRPWNRTGGGISQQSTENLLINGCVRLGPSGTAPYYGPYIDIDIIPGCKSFEVAFRPYLSLENMVVGSTRTLFEFWSTLGTDTPVLSVKAYCISAGRVLIRLINAAGAVITTTTYDITEPEWVAFILYEDPGNPLQFGFFTVVNNRFIGAYSGYPLDVKTITKVFLGARANPAAPYKGFDGLPLEFAGFYAGKTGALPDYPADNFLFPGAPTDPDSIALSRMPDYAGVPDSFTGPAGDDVLYGDIDGLNALEVQHRIARSISSVTWAAPSGQLSHIARLGNRSNNVAFTVELGSDDTGADITLGRSVDSKPSKVTVNAEFGATIVENGEAVINREMSIDTYCIDSTAAAIAGGRELSRSTALRVLSVSVDLVTCISAITTQVLAMFPGTRFRVGGFNPNILGYTRADYFAVGWSEVYTPTSAVFTISTETADSPVQAQFDNVVFGRHGTDGMTATGGTALTTTANGTLILNANGGVPLTQRPGDYPLDLSLGGERVTITNPPASAVSPQTVTVTARGVAPSIPFVHAAGVPVDMWRPAQIAI